MTNKKQGYWQFFLKRFVILLIAAALLCAAATAALEMVMTDMVRTQSYSEILNTSNAILQNDSDSPDINVIDFALCLYHEPYTEQETGMHKATVVVDEQTGEIVTDSSLKLFAVLRDNPEDDSSIIVCHDKDVIDFLVGFAGRNIILDMDEVYIREDKTFRPAEITITELEESPVGEKGEVIGRQDFTPADKAGYTICDNVKLKIMTGSFPDDELLLALNRAVAGAADSAAAFDAMLELYISRPNTCSMDNTTTFSRGGRNYLMYTMVEFDFWGAWGEFMLAVYIAAFVIAVIAALIWAKIAHIKYSAKYQNDQLRRNMVNALAHDLKSPLMAISGYAENLASDAHPEKREHYTAAIIENAEYMNSIIYSTLELSRTENISAIHKEQVDVAALLGVLYEKYLPEAEGRGISLSTEGGCTVKADRALLSQALENLLTNAVRYTTEGGRITVRMDEKSISVANPCKNGSELAKLDLASPFVKGSESRTDRTGTGMGLAIAKTACERQKFRLEIKPEKESFTAIIRF